MKKLIYLPIFVLFFACQKDTADNSNTANQAVSAAETTENISANEPKMSYKFKPEGAVGLSDPQKALMNGIWAIEGYVEVIDKEAQQKNVGRWYNFGENGKYERGRYENKQGSGTWTFDEKTKLLTLEDEEATNSSQFKVRIMPNGQTMIVVGTQKFAQNGMQAKMVVMEDYPKQ